MTSMTTNRILLNCMFVVVCMLVCLCTNTIFAVTIPLAPKRQRALRLPTQSHHLHITDRLVLV